LLNDKDLFSDRKLCDQALTRELDQVYGEEDTEEEGVLEVVEDSDRER